MIQARTVTQAIGVWLFQRKPVYLVSAPGRMLKQKQIHWDRQTCDVEDKDGRVIYDVPWDDLEFWDPVDYHLPDED